MGPPRRGQPRIAQVMAVVDSDDPETIVDRLQPLAEIAPLLDQAVQSRRTRSVMANAGAGVSTGRGEPVAPLRA